MPCGRLVSVLELRHTDVVNIQASWTDAPATEGGTRERVLAAVTERGPISASALGRDLGLTPAGVRRHLDALATEGAIVERDAPISASTTRGRGRPARMWVIAPAGHDSLPADYDDLAVDALRFLRERSGSDAVASFARRRAAQLQSRYAGDVGAAGTEPQARAEALVAALSRDGFAASARPVGVGALAGVQVCQGHCPVRHVAAEFPEFCQAETDAFSDLLGVHVQRLSTIAAGQHVCTTFVPIATTGTALSPRPKGHRA